jgi:hypothetical protein
MQNLKPKNFQKVSNQVFLMLFIHLNYFSITHILPLTKNQVHHMKSVKRNLMKFNQLVQFIHHLLIFISIQLLIKVAWGASIGVAFISLLLSEVRVV